MKREIVLGGTTIEYEFTQKPVKNINLRIRPDGSIYVSANRWVSKGMVERFMQEKSGFILNARKRCESRKGNAPEPLVTEAEICREILELCHEVYPYYAQKGIPFPHIRFRNMVSQWGSCNREKGVLTFNKKLAYAPKACVLYVVHHEFTHFLEPNHQKPFYEALSKVCPDWKALRARLKEIVV